MKRLQTVVAAISALLLALVLSMWARSHWVTDAVERRDLVPGTSSHSPLLRRLPTIERHRVLVSRRGLLIGTQAHGTPRYGPSSRVYDAWNAINADWIDSDYLLRSRHLKRRLGFIVHQNHSIESVSVNGVTTPRWIIAVPYWSLALCLSIAPLVYVVRRVRSARRHVHGACPTCGYDVRATPDRCPECGNAVRSPAVDTSL